MTLIKPKMIIFDYGHTLAYEDEWDKTAGERAVLARAASNKHGVTPEQAGEFAERIYLETRAARAGAMEIHQFQLHRFVYEYLGVEVGLPPEETELIYWDAAAPAYAMPHIAETLSFLRDNGIRSSVISNISFSSATVKRRVDRLLPDNDFEFIVASSEYIFRKPNKYIFEIALMKAGLHARDVWYCGDSPEFDVEGAHAAGMFPVWFDSPIPCWYIERGHTQTPVCDHLHIADWRELTDVLSRLM